LGTQASELRDGTARKKADSDVRTNETSRFRNLYVSPVPDL
jgi:hypothetical protein